MSDISTVMILLAPHFLQSSLWQAAIMHSLHLRSGDLCSPLWRQCIHINYLELYCKWFAFSPSIISWGKWSSCGWDQALVESHFTEKWTVYNGEHCACISEWLFSPFLNRVMIFFFFFFGSLLWESGIVLEVELMKVWAQSLTAALRWFSLSF